ncbi:hypothetical protein SDC9_114967 [bioreactor metagenome]|uniref:Uncharacterized protein n=1 Tax=bioreactor metagenome TaxID=1076179 RepID=A0A645BTT4_9ZZZZ
MIDDPATCHRKIEPGPGIPVLQDDDLFDRFAAQLVLKVDVRPRLPVDDARAVFPDRLDIVRADRPHRNRPASNTYRDAFRERFDVGTQRAGLARELLRIRRLRLPAAHPLPQGGGRRLPHHRIEGVVNRLPVRSILVIALIGRILHRFRAIIVDIRGGESSTPADILRPTALRILNHRLRRNTGLLRHGSSLLHVG